MGFSFSTAAVRPKDRFEYFHEAVARSYVRCDLSVPNDASFFADIELKPIDCLNVSMIRSSALHAFMPRLTRESSVPEIVFVNVVLEGCARTIQDGREVETGPGQISLLDSARPFTVDIRESVTHFVIEVPRAELAARIGPIEKARARAYSARTPEGMLATGFMRQLFANSTAGLSETAPALARQAVDLVALALGDGSNDVVKRLSSPVAVTRLRLRHAIDFSIAEGLRTCDEVAGMAGISPRYANMLLAQEGTSLERLIVLRRLEKCRGSLADPAQGDIAISEIARRWGFESPSHFARAFKATFGMTARDYRYAQREAVLARSAVPDRLRVASRR